MSDGEQEVRRTALDQESDLDYQDSQEGQDNDEISQLATQLENQTLISYPGLALQSSSADLDKSMPAHFVTDPVRPLARA